MMHAIAGVNDMMELMPSTTLGIGSVLVTNPIAIKPKVITPLLIRTPTLTGNSLLLAAGIVKRFS